MLQHPTLVPVTTFCLLLLAMSFKHYAADFVLQTNWIARGKEAARGWQMPLALHALSHAAITLCIALVLVPRLWWLAVVDLLVHAAIDRGKSLVARRAKWEFRQPQFWWLMGFDQFMHQATNVALVAALVAL